MAKNIVHTEEEQTNIFENLAASMMQGGQLINVPQIPGAVDMSGTTPADVAGGKTPGAANPAKKAGKGTDQSVTANVANQGQLIPIAPPVSPTGTSDDIGDLKRIIGQVAGQENPAGESDSGGKSGGGSDILGTIVDVGLAFIGWIICTELVRQGKMPRKWWVKGAKVFAAYPEFVKQGYYLWAIPCVHHLRARPDSLFSRFLCMVFNARARSVAEKPTAQGIAVTVILWPICYVLGAILWMLNKRPDWSSVYVRD